LSCKIRQLLQNTQDVYFACGTFLCDCRCKSQKVRPRNQGTDTEQDKKDYVPSDFSRGYFGQHFAQTNDYGDIRQNLRNDQTGNSLVQSKERESNPNPGNHINKTARACRGGILRLSICQKQI